VHPTTSIVPFPLLAQTSGDIVRVNIKQICSPKYRDRVLRDDVEAYTQEQIYALCQQQEGVEVPGVNVHFMCT
jgi:hypothetical protein